MNRKQLLFGVVAIAAIAVLVAAYLLIFRNNSDDTTAAVAGGGDMKLVSTDRHLGSPKAPITLIEYAAPTCPHCSHFNETLFGQLKSSYIDTGKVYYVFRVFPISQVDYAAEAMARCLPPDNYFQFIDLLFRNQPKWDPEYQIQDVHGALVQMGKIAGMSAEQVDKCIANQSEQQRIAQVAQEAQTKFSVSSTPTFIANGQTHVGGFEDFQALKDWLDPMLKKS